MKTDDLSTGGIQQPGEIILCRSPISTGELPEVYVDQKSGGRSPIETTSDVIGFHRYWLVNWLY